MRAHDDDWLWLRVVQFRLDHGEVDLKLVLLLSIVRFIAIDATILLTLLMLHDSFEDVDVFVDESRLDHLLELVLVNEQVDQLILLHIFLPLLRFLLY